MTVPNLTKKQKKQIGIKQYLKKNHNPAMKSLVKENEAFIGCTPVKMQTSKFSATQSEQTSLKFRVLKPDRIRNVKLSTTKNKTNKDVTVVTKTLKKKDDTKGVAPKKKQTRKFWTVQEEKALKDGLKKHEHKFQGKNTKPGSKGIWATIKEDAEFGKILVNRSGQQLKDKARWFQKQETAKQKSRRRHNHDDDSTTLSGEKLQ